MQLANKLFFAQVEAMLAEGQDVALRVKGYSMRPLLRNERDVVVLTPYRPDTPLRNGEIVLFRFQGRHILHRIVEIENNRLTLAGDGNYRQREHCTISDVVAVASRVIRKNGREIRCDSRKWLRMSRAWCALPAPVRRYILAVLFRLGYK